MVIATYTIKKGMDRRLLQYTLLLSGLGYNEEELTCESAQSVDLL